MKKVFHTLVQSWPITFTAVIGILLGITFGATTENVYHWVPMFWAHFDQPRPFMERHAENICPDQPFQKLTTAPARCVTLIELDGDWTCLAPVVDFCNWCYREIPRDRDEVRERYAALKPRTI